MMNIIASLRKLKLSRQLWLAWLAFPVVGMVFIIVLFLLERGDSASAYSYTITIGLGLILVICITYRYIRQFTIRIQATRDAAAALSQGNLTARIDTTGADEITEIGIAINTITQRLLHTAQFVQQIGTGTATAIYEPLGKNDLLGHSLLTMRDNLNNLQKQEQKRNWATEGLAKFVEILRLHDNLQDVSNEIVRNLVRMLNANQGALFLLTNETEEPYLEMKGCYAYQRTKYLTQQIAVGQGLVGQTFLEKETMYLREIPDDFVRITSGLGDANPRNILIVPLKMNEEIIGVIELASFQEFAAHEISFVEKLGENIAHTVISFQVNENTKKLLLESQQQAEYMQAQEEELRQNQEELQAIQEEISRRYNALFKQLHELNYQSCFDLLRSITSTKKRNIEYYFDIIRNQILTMAESTMIISAVRDFKAAFRQVGENVTDNELLLMQQSLRHYYTSEFIPRLNAYANQQASADEYIPTQASAVVLQYHYIANNPHPTGQKSMLDTARDGSGYSRVHAKYHPVIRSFQEKFGYYDIFLIDPETGDMLYSVFKEVDFATSLLNGLYHTTNFGTVVKEAAHSNESDFTRLIDFEPYDPSYRAPASFIACPVYDGNEKIGILVFQMPIHRINQILTGDNHWREDGLGESGETFMVGSDYKLRSIVRELVENPAGHLKALERAGYTAQIIRQIQKANTSILLEEIRQDCITQALQGTTGTQMQINHRGEEMLYAYAPLAITDVNWVIVSAIKQKEASERIEGLRNTTR